ncbi:SURF1 family protein, partial [Cognatilysobacter lacus]|uniref:SURF1 family protein n=1 Tax=Cognatilysobacter lacus TaxID=1643323 RepID=UPI001659C709
MSARGRLIVGWACALVLATGFARLGVWQLHRAVEKEHLLADVGRVLHERRPQPLVIAANSARALDYDWAAGRGRFLATPPLFLDNQQREGRVGVRDYAVFQPVGGMPMLVDMGWLPIGAARVLPHVSAPAGEVDVRGL